MMGSGKRLAVKIFMFLVTSITERLNDFLTQSPWDCGLMGSSLWSVERIEI
jgi:hypothetical protein